jgi:hypothetical protein
VLQSLHKYIKWTKQPQRSLVPHSRTENEMKTHSYIIEGVFLRLRCIYFQKNTSMWPQNFRHQKSNTKKVPYWGPTHIRCHHTKLNSWATWCPAFMHPSTKVMLYHGHYLKYKVIHYWNLMPKLEHTSCVVALGICNTTCHEDSTSTCAYQWPL